VLAALGANLGIAVVKFLAFLLTQSSSMLAESIHSVADSGNQVLLLVGGRRARRQPSPEHPFGYGRERYIYGFIVSIVLFAVGGLFALYEGYHKIEHPEAIHAWQWVPVLVLVVSIALETNSFRTAWQESKQARRGISVFQYIRRAKAPELPVVLLEDAAALIGLFLALFGVGLTLLTGNGIWDGVGTLAIGALLVCVSVTLAIETKSLLLGESASPADVRAIEQAIVDGPEVDRIIHMRTLHLGPDELLVAAKIAVHHGGTAGDVARGIDAAEARIRAAVPIAALIYLEPDLFRGAGQVRPDAGAATTGKPGGGPDAGESMTGKDR
jgi:cation diffusion facilitator family transporter